MSDDGLEAAIDRVGRKKVFAMATAYGWTFANTPPRYVWWQIVREIESQLDLPLEPQKERPAP